MSLKDEAKIYLGLTKTDCPVITALDMIDAELAGFERGTPEHRKECFRQAKERFEQQAQ